jgi:hypothetical protein
MATINPDIEAVVEDKLKANEQPPASLRQAGVKERNIVSVKAKKDQPQFTYNRVYVSMRHGKCLEYNLGDAFNFLLDIKLFLYETDGSYFIYFVL